GTRFLGPPTTFFQLAPGEQDVFPVRYQPNHFIGEDTGTVLIVANARASSSAAVVLDLSLSLGERFDGHVTRAEATQLALGELIAHLARTAEIRDSLAVIAATDDGAMVLHPLTHEKRALAALSPRPGRRDSTCVAAALQQALDELATTDRQKSLLLFTAQGDPDTAICGAGGFSLLRERAQREGIVVSCLVFGDAVADTLAAMCNGTSGMFRRVANITQLREALALVIARLGVAGDIRIPLRAESITSVLAFGATDGVLPDARVGEKVCAEIPVRNIGLDTLILRSAAFLPENGFSTDESFPLRIPANDSLLVTCCFAPTRPGIVSVPLLFETNSCIDVPSLILQSRGWDSTAVFFSDEIHTRPGSLVRIPLTMSEALTAAYNVRRLDMTVTYNPTLLYPDLDLPLEDAFGRPMLGAAGSVRQDFDTARFLAQTIYSVVRMQESPLETTGTDHLLGYLRFRTYLGNAVSTELSIVHLQAEAEDFRLRGRGVTIVFIDSLPWVENRLVNPTALYGITLGKHRPNPVRETAVIPYRLSEPTQLRLALYDNFGRCVRIVKEGFLSPGSYNDVIDTRDLAAGVYVYRIETTRGAESRIMLVIR
ncbi:MAG: VWA domain-containing protein, partial [Bacteroidetes bacterium]|nr:VWA domain-containing protein [Bacteroidota bacterium]